MKKREAIINEYINGYNSFDIQAMTKHLSADIIFDNIQNDKITMHLAGIEAFTKQAEAAKMYFTTRKQTPSNFVHFEDRTEVEIVYQGMAAIDFPNGIRKGDTLNLNGKSVFYFKELTITKIVDIS